MRALAQSVEPFFDPPDGGAERDAELADLAFDAELVELLPERVVVDRIEARVVELVQIDVVGTEPPERRFELRTNRRGLPVLTSFRLALRAGGVDVVPALRGEHDLTAV